MATRDRWLWGLRCVAGVLGLAVVLLIAAAAPKGCSLDTAKPSEVTWCWEFWLNRYQTLLTGIFALIAAAIAWRGVVEQVAVARLPLITQDGSKARALRDEAEEIDWTILTSIARLVEECRLRIQGISRARLLDIEPTIDWARKDLDRRWIDNLLTDAAAEALRDYAITTIGIGGEAGRLVRRSNRLAAKWAIRPVPGGGAIARRHHEKALDLQQQQSRSAKLFFSRLEAERASIARQRAGLLGLPVEPT